MLFIKGNIILDKNDAIDYLYSLGFDNFDVIEFIRLLNQNEELTDWKAEAKAWEEESIAEFEKRNELICEIQNLADELASGKGGTKIQYADKLRNACEFWY